MKIYKGAQSKNQYDVLHNPESLVDTQDLSKNFEAWEYEKIIPVNITIKSDSERQSVAYICLEEADIIALHQGLLLSLRERASKKNDLEAALNKINNHEFSIKNYHTKLLLLKSKHPELHDLIKQFKEISKSALDKIARCV